MMNQTNNPVAAQALPDDDAIDLGAILDILLENRLLIGSIALAVTLDALLSLAAALLQGEAGD